MPQYNTNTPEAQAAKKASDEILVAIKKAAAEHPLMIDFLQEDIRRQVPGAEIGIVTWSLKDFEGYDRLTPEQQDRLQGEMYSGFDGCEHASPENLENFETEAKALIEEMLGNSPAP